MTTLSYSLVVFRVKKSEMGKVTTTTRKESSSRMRERPFNNRDQSVDGGDGDNVTGNLQFLVLIIQRVKKNKTMPASAGSGSGGLFAIASQILVFLGNPTILETFACPHQNLSFGPTSNLLWLYPGWLAIASTWTRFVCERCSWLLPPGPHSITP